MNKNYFYFLTFSASLASFNFGILHLGYNIAVFNNLSEKLRIESTSIQIYCPAGAILGTLIGCKFSTSYGRRNCFFLLNALNIVGNSLVCDIQTLGIYNNFEGNSGAIQAIVYIGRIICGLSVGMTSFVVPLYSKLYTVREMSPSEIYARLGSINQFMITFGILLAYCSVFLITAGESMVLLIFCFPILVSFVQIGMFLVIFKTDTPTFMMSKNRVEDALKIMNELYFNNSSVTLADDAFGSQLGNEYQEVTYKDLFTPKYFKNFKMGCILSILQQLSGINYIIFASAFYLKNAEGLNIYESICIIGLVNCISGSFSVFLLKDRYKKFLKIGALGMSLCYLIIISGIFINFQYFNLLYLICILFFIVCFEFSIGPIMWIYCADVLTDKGISLSTALNWVGALTIGGIFSIKQVKEVFVYHDNGGVQNLYFFFMNLMYMCACLIVWNI